MLSHLAHPHPDIAPVQLAEPIGGAVLISPWVTFDQSAASLTSNQYKDMLTAITLRTMSDSYIGSKESDPYLEPLKAPAGWWQSLPVSKILHMGGGDELFLDDIKKIGTILTKELPRKVTTIISPNTAHDQPLLDYIVDLGKPGEQAEAFANFVATGG